MSPLLPSAAPDASRNGQLAAGGNGPVRPFRPTHLGIHLLDETSRLVYVSSGIRQCLGFTPEEMLNKSAYGFVCDGFDSKDYMTLYEANQSADATIGNDGASAYVLYVNFRSASGQPMFTRVTLFPCDNCVLFTCMMYPDAPLSQRTELEVQVLDKEMRKMNVTRERDRKDSEALAQPGGRRAPMYTARNNQVKAAFVLEHPVVADIEHEMAGERHAGPLVVFVTGSVSRLVDADTSDLMHAPFMQLVAPEDLLHVAKYFDSLAASTEVLFETFSLLSRPPVVEGDIEVADEDNHRVVVECLGGSSQDGLAILVRKLRTAPAPKRDTAGNYIHSRLHMVEDRSGFIPLSELISSDPDTSDVPEAWSQLC